jgi:hypothetical protein
MYMVNKSDKSITKIDQTTFSQEQLEERYDLQEWIDKNPDSLGEDLLIIQKEFDRFDKTSERLDLLALDTLGNLVVIENKRDDSGKDVTWQSIKYAAYCSTLTSEQITDLYQQYLNKYWDSQNAEDRLIGFLGQDYSERVNINAKPRIIIVSREYRSEVTASALWLRSCGIDIKCIKTSLFKINDDIIFDAHQIIPIKDAEDFMVKVSNKEQESETRNLRAIQCFNFWKSLAQQLDSEYGIDISPSDRTYVSTRLGLSGCSIGLIANTKYMRLEIYLSGSKEEEYFDILEQNKKELESLLGQDLEFERVDDKKISRIQLQVDGYNIYDTAMHSEIYDFFMKYAPIFIEKLAPKVKEIIDNN